MLMFSSFMARFVLGPGQGRVISLLLECKRNSPHHKTLDRVYKESEQYSEFLLRLSQRLDVQFLFWLVLY